MALCKEKKVQYRRQIEVRRKNNKRRKAENLSNFLLLTSEFYKFLQELINSKI